MNLAQIFHLFPATRVDGIDVRGYTYTSLLDDYVWQYGDNRKFGLADTAPGKLKKSASTYAEIIAGHGVLRQDPADDGGNGDQMRTKTNTNSGTGSGTCAICSRAGSGLSLSLPLVGLVFWLTLRHMDMPDPASVQFQLV